MTLLLVVQLLVCGVTLPAASAAGVGCTTAAGGECRALVSSTESACNSNVDKHTEMISHCCPECITDSDCLCSRSGSSNCLSHLTQHWSTYSGVIPSSSISLVPHPNYNLSFNLTISWNKRTDASGYEVHVQEATKHSINRTDNFLIGRFTTDQPDNTQLTLSNICFNRDKSYLIIKVKVTGGSELLGQTHLQRCDCYTLYEGNTTLRDKYCGPMIPNELDISKVKNCTKSEGGGLFSATISWPKVSQADSYEIMMENGTKSKFYRVTNSTSVLFSSLNSSIEYRVKIVPISMCVGMYIDRESWKRCTEADTIRIRLSNVPVTSPCSSLPSSPSNDLDTNVTSSPYSSLPSSPLSPIYAISTVEVPTVAKPPNNSSQAPHVTIILGLALSISLLLIFLVIFLIIIYRRRRRLSKQVPSTPSSIADTLSSSLTPVLLFPPSSPLSSAPFPSPLPFSPTHDGYVEQSFSLPTDQLKVLVLYSLETPEDQEMTINQLLYAGLRQCGMLVETPGTVPNKQFNRERVEKAVVEASAVFFVCNDQFYKEWISEDSTAGCGGKIGRDVRMIKNAAGNSTLAKCAFAHFEASDEEFFKRYPEVVTPFITRYFSLSGDKLETVRSIASFVKNIPKYELETYYTTVSDAS